MTQTIDKMDKWIDIIKYANNGSLKPDRRVEKTDAEWKAILTAEQYRITRQQGTESPHSSDMCSHFEPGIYSCVCCKTKLFDGSEKFESGTGWPSFTQPLKANLINYVKDTAHGMVRIEATCNTCDAHLGHVFPDGPEPSGLRYCLNAEALERVTETEKKAIFGGGCYWCTDAVFTEVKGVLNIRSGFTGGSIANPTYREVCSGRTGHAEVIEITYDPEVISYKELLEIHMLTHDPTTLNRQGGDVGTQYRSGIYYKTEEEKQRAEEVIKELEDSFPDNIVTEIKPLDVFYEAQEEHQDYYANNSEAPYCQAVISPKLQKLRAKFQTKLKTATPV